MAEPFTGPGRPAAAPAGPLGALRALAGRISGSDAVGIRRIAEEANRLILEYRLEPEQIVAALVGIPNSARLLTGFGHLWTAEEVVALMANNMEFAVRAMKAFPGKRSMINLDKLVDAINEGDFKIYEN
jgi:hypothetical protein